MSIRRVSRTRWQGWTIVDKDNGDLIFQPDVSVPMIFSNKRDAELEKQIENEKVVRCEVRVIR